MVFFLYFRKRLYEAPHRVFPAHSYPLWLLCGTQRCEGGQKAKKAVYHFHTPVTKKQGILFTVTARHKKARGKTTGLKLKTDQENMLSV